MSATPGSDALDRNTEIGALGVKAKGAIMRIFIPLCVVLALASAVLNFSEKPGGGAFALMSVGTCAALRIWCSDARGLPLLPLMAIQSLLIYGTPIAVGHEVISTYPPSFVSDAGIEVLIFNLTMVLTWKIGMQLFRPSPPVSYALREFSKEGTKGWSRLGLGMIIAATGFDVIQSLGFMDSMTAALPSGTISIIAALVSVVSACGFFLVSMTLGRRETSVVAKAIFWTLLVVNGMISASEFLLYGAAANIITVAIGFFWSSGRVPWRYLTVSMLALSFLNTGKTIMRQRYWGTEEVPAVRVTFDKMPALYGEWIKVSYDATLEKNDSKDSNANGTTGQLKENQTLLDRIDNLQNLLFVIDATKTQHVTLLNGATYSLIPPLLVPRIFWADKPRSHEGQVILNVHFGRQELNSTIDTYIAWGLLPEAYGNYGPGFGAAFIGFVLGLSFAWIENFTARKLFISMEGFLSISLLMNLMNSFEMVASVLVTSVFQSFVIVIAMSLPFVSRTTGIRIDPQES
jgi:hypothetical protein